MKKSTLLMIVSVVLALTLSLGSTLAYLQDSDSDVNVMTLGSVYIEQIEQEWNADKNELKEFTQEKPLYPYVGELGWENDAEDGGAYRRFTMSNAVDKYVSVKNTGKSPAYVRTIIALEMGSYNEADFNMVGVSINSEDGAEFDFPGTWNWNEGFVANIDGANYWVMVATHKDPVAAGATTIPSLLQVYLKNTAGNEEVENLDGNGNGYYDILTLSQAVQTAGFDKAETALNAAFNPDSTVAAKVPEWFDGVTPPFNADNADDTWYDANAKTLTIKNAQQLASLAAMVNEGTDNFRGKTIVLANDIDLLGMEWAPIGIYAQQSQKYCFAGTFDGQNHTISNYKVDNVDDDNAFYAYEKGAGLFGSVCGTVKNLNVENVTIDTNRMAGAIVGQLVDGHVLNCSAKNVTITCLPEAMMSRSVSYDNGDKAGAIVGNATGTATKVENCYVEDATITAYRDAGAVAGFAGGSVKNNVVNGATLIKNNVHDYKDKADDNTVNAIVGRLGDSAQNENNTGAETVNFGSTTPVANVSDMNSALSAAVAAGQTDIVVDAAGAELNLNYGVSTATVPAGTTVTIANANVTGKSYGNAVDGTVVFENCTFENPNGAYSIHFDAGSGDVVFKNCTLSGWCSFGTAIKSVTMENCTIKGNGIYAMNRFYQPATLNNCTIDCSNAVLDDVYTDGISAVGATVTLNGCNINNDPDMEVSDGGKIVVDGVVVAQDTTDGE